MAVEWDKVFKRIAEVKKLGLGITQKQVAKEFNINPDSITRKKRQMREAAANKPDQGQTKTDKKQTIDTKAVMEGLKDIGLIDEPDIFKADKIPTLSSLKRTIRQKEEEITRLKRDIVNIGNSLTRPKQTELSLVDLKDEFELWLVSLDMAKYTSNRAAILNRVQKFKRPALIDGTLNLLSQYLKLNKIKLVK